MSASCPYSSVNLNGNLQRWDSIIKPPHPYRMEPMLLDDLPSWKPFLQQTQEQIRRCLNLTLSCHYFFFKTSSTSIGESSKVTSGKSIIFKYTGTFCEDVLDGFHQSHTSLYSGSSSNSAREPFLFLHIHIFIISPPLVKQSANNASNKACPQDLKANLPNYAHPHILLFRIRYPK